MHGVQDVGRHLQYVVDDLSLGEEVGVVVDGLQQLRVGVEGLLLELVVGVDFVAFALQQPCHGLGVDIVLFVV